MTTSIKLEDYVFMESTPGPPMIRNTQFAGVEYYALNIHAFNMEHHFNLIQDDRDGLHKHNIAKIEWCGKEFGPSGVYWTKPPYANCRWIANNGELWFKDQLDLFAFILRWT
jgi:hypothetical protein